VPVSHAAARQTFQIAVGDKRFACATDEKVLIAMEKAGVKEIQVGCRGGGCGTCRVHVDEGEVERLRMAKIHVSDAEADQGFALSCRIRPKSDLTLTPARKIPACKNPDRAASQPG
jgi:ferredoxin